MTPETMAERRDSAITRTAGALLGIGGMLLLSGVTVGGLAWYWMNGPQSAERAGTREASESLTVTPLSPAGPPAASSPATAPAADRVGSAAAPPSGVRPGGYQPRGTWDSSGFSLVFQFIPPWPADASLEEIGKRFTRAGYRAIEQIDRQSESAQRSGDDRIRAWLMKAALWNYEGEPHQAYQTLSEAREYLDRHPQLARQYLYTTIFFQGIAGLRQGENENCILCRGESSCILPIAPAAIHTNPSGSRLAIRHFTEYLEQFPDDLAVRWLLNIAHMTLGEHPQQVEPRYLVSLAAYQRSEFDLGRFRDVGEQAGVNRLNQAGGGVLDDFDNDGWLDIAITTMDPAGSMALYYNTGNGTFAERAVGAGLQQQLGGLNCVQADYDNDGQLDLLILRGAWLPENMPMRMSLLRNQGDQTFRDVTAEAGLDDPIHSIAAAWADYDNDGWLDLWVCGEQQPSRLYRNARDGRFEEVTAAAGLVHDRKAVCKGASWLDYDNDGDQDLFLNFLTEYGAQLYRNESDGRFTRVTSDLGIDGPDLGFACWSWDYDNDGWLDLFATCYDHPLEGLVQGVIGEPHRARSNRLFRNQHGERFEDRTREAGLDLVLATMGSNYGDFDNDGFLDMYLGTGNPNLATLFPNRMFKNVAGARFADVTASTGTGNLQKGHGTGCGDYDRDGDVDIFMEMGGAIPGDRYHNLLLQNPGHGRHSLTVKLIGRQTNRSALGARIRATVAGDPPLTVCRTVSSGGSFGANPLEQTIGVGEAETIAELEIHWPTSGTTQIFRDVPADGVVEITEFAPGYRRL